MIFRPRLKRLSFQSNMLFLDLESHQKQLCFLLPCCKSLFVCVFAEMSLGCVSAKNRPPSSFVVFTYQIQVERLQSFGPPRCGCWPGPPPLCGILSERLTTSEENDLGGSSGRCRESRGLDRSLAQLMLKQKTNRGLSEVILCLGQNTLAITAWAKHFHVLCGGAGGAPAL